MVAKGSPFSRESWKVKSWEGRYSLLSMWDFKPLLNLIKTRLLDAFGLWEWGGCKYRFKAEIWCPPLIIVASRVNPRWWCHVMWDFDHDIWTYAMFWILWILHVWCQKTSNLITNKEGMYERVFEWAPILFSPSYEIICRGNFRPGNCNCACWLVAFRNAW